MVTIIKNLSLKFKLPIFLGIFLSILLVAQGFLRFKEVDYLQGRYKNTIREKNTIALSGVMLQTNTVIEKELNNILFTDELSAFLLKPASVQDKLVMSGLFLSLAEKNFVHYSIYSKSFKLLLQEQVDTNAEYSEVLPQELRSTFLTAAEDFMPKFYFRTFGKDNASSIHYCGVISVTDDEDQLIGYVELAIDNTTWVPLVAKLTGTQTALLAKEANHFSNQTDDLLYNKFQDFISKEDINEESIIIKVTDKTYFSDRFPLLNPKGKELGRLWLTSDYTVEIKSDQTRVLIQIATFLLIGAFSIFSMLYAIQKLVTSPLATVVDMVEQMKEGVIKQRLHMGQKDEIGRMANSMDKFADDLQHNVVASLEMLSNGDLSFEIAPKGEDDAIGTALQKTGEDLSSMIMEIQMAAEQIATSSNQVSDASQSLSQGASESAASLEQITSSMTEMAAQTKTNAENSGQANQLAGQARDAADKGNEHMSDLVKAIDEINESGQNVSKIIKVIDEIAFQTNLLALNAAVEAARAGKHGKGFAVVAEEVRNLAARSAKAAQETAELIEGSVEKAQNGTEIAGRTSEALAEIVNGATKVTDLVGEIAAASNEQAQGISQVNQGLNQIEQVTQQNTASAEESAAAAEELLSQAHHLQSMMGRFKIKGQNTMAEKSVGQPALPHHEIQEEA